MVEAELVVPLPPHLEQVLLDGYHLSTRTTRLPFRSALYSSIRVKLPQPLSLTDLPKFKLLFMAAISRVSMLMTSYSSVSLQEILCSISSRCRLVFACSFAIYCLCFS